MKADWTVQLSRRNACSEAVQWAKTQPSFTAAWNNCERGDWMLWLAGRVGIDRKMLVIAACACARTALKYVKEGKKQPRICIETAERWARGKATIEEVGQARSAAYAAYAYAADAYAYAAAAAAAAAYAAYAADAYAAAAYAAAAYAYAAAAAADRKRYFKKCAALVRKTISARRVSLAMGKAA